MTAADKKRQKPEVMQLATVDGNYIAVIKLSCVFPGIQPESTEATVVKYSVLKSVFDHPRIQASGVGVKGDITRFLKHYHEGLVSSNLQKRVFDALQPLVRSNMLLNMDGMKEDWRILWRSCSASESKRYV